MAFDGPPSQPRPPDETDDDAPLFGGLAQEPDADETAEPAARPKAKEERELPEGLAEQLAALPPRPGCYLFYNRRNELLYVGKALSLRSRVRSYFHRDRNRAPKIRRLVKQITRLEWREVPTELHALVLECRLIKEHLPRFNAALKGDKRLPRLRMTVEEPFPRVFLDWGAPNDVSRYFGPFTRHDSAEDLLDVLYRVFKLRSCDLEFGKKRDMRPCLYYDLDQCLAPCCKRICSEEEYAEAVRAAMDFLEGCQESLADRLGREMELAAESLLFERAARLRDMRQSVVRWMERQNFLAGWEEAGSGLFHLFLVRGARLEGHCILRPETRSDAAARQSAVGAALRQTYASSPSPSHLLGPVAIEELNIMETWLVRKQAAKAYLSPPQSPEDHAALERMLAQVEAWTTGG